MLEGPARKFSRFRQTASFDIPESAKHGANDGDAPMNLELGYILPCFTEGRRKPDDHGAVERFTCPRMTDGAKRGMARLGSLPDHHLEDRTDPRPGDANDGNAGSAGSTRKRVDS